MYLSINSNYVKKYKMINKIKYSDHFDPYFLLLAIFSSCLVIAQFLAAKLIKLDIPSVGVLVFPSGILAYGVTFLCTDVISEVWGKKRASITVFCGLLAVVTSLILIKLSMALPAKPGWMMTEPFNEISSMIVRVTFGSIAAYLVSQYHDVFMFHFLKKATKGRFLWLRNNISTILSQLLDTVIFVVIAFYGKIDMAGLIALITGQFFVKIVIAMFDTPFVYLLVKLIRKHIHKQEILEAAIDPQ